MKGSDSVLGGSGIDVEHLHVRIDFWLAMVIFSVSMGLSVRDLWIPSFSGVDYRSKPWHRFSVSHLLDTCVFLQLELLFIGASLVLRGLSMS